MANQQDITETGAAHVAILEVAVTPSEWEHHYLEPYTDLAAVLARVNEELAPIGVVITEQDAS